MSTTATILPPAQRRLVMVLCMAATFIVVLDSTIANVVLPHMQSSLGASPDSISWVLTSYILASAVALPVTGYLSDRLGRRTLFTAATLGFTASSMLCGAAATLPLMVIARIAQGLCGAFLAPMSQAIMYDTNPPEKHVQAMTLWGMVIMVGPVLGPVIGGVITDQFDWRWVFYINVPIGIATAAASWALLTDDAPVKRRFDILGFVLIAACLSSIQLMLDRGVSLDWFDATEIWVELAVSVAALWMFIIHTAGRDDTLVPRALFTDRNFVASLVTITVVGGILMAGAALVAPMLQRLLNYPVVDAGLLTAPRGAGTMAGMLLAGRMAKRFDPRLLIGVGISLVAVSLSMMSGFDLEMDNKPVIYSGFLQGFGLGLTVLPLNLLALATLPGSLRTEGAALCSLMRSIGGSIAISALTALIAANTQVSHGDLGAHVSTTRAPFLNAGLFERIGVQGQDVMRMIDAEINRQAVMVAYIDDYWLMMWAAVAVLPLIIFLRATRAGETMPMPDAH